MGRTVKLEGEVIAIDLDRCQVRIGKWPPEVRDGRYDFELEYSDVAHELVGLRVGQRVEVTVRIDGGDDLPARVAAHLPRVMWPAVLGPSPAVMAEPGAFSGG